MKIRVARSCLALGMLTVAAVSGGCQTPSGPRVNDQLPDPFRGSAQLPPPSEFPPPRPQPTTPKPRSKPATTAPPRTTGSATSTAGWMPRGGVDRKWKYIIVHHSANDRGSPQGIDSWHRQRGWDELGYHFVIGNGVDYPDGAVFVGSRWPKQKHGAHTRISKNDDNRWNLGGIGICLIGNFEQGRPTRKQLDSLSRLVAFLMDETGIPMNRVYQHHDVDPHTRCAGRNFPMNKVKQQVAAVQTRSNVRASTR